MKKRGGHSSMARCARGAVTAHDPEEKCVKKRWRIRRRRAFSGWLGPAAKLMATQHRSKKRHSSKQQQQDSHESRLRPQPSRPGRACSNDRPRWPEDSSTTHLTVETGETEFSCFVPAAALDSTLLACHVQSLRRTTALGEKDDGKKRQRKKRRFRAVTAIERLRAWAAVRWSRRLWIHHPPSSGSTFCRQPVALRATAGEKKKKRPIHVTASVSISCVWIDRFWAGKKKGRRRRETERETAAKRRITHRQNPRPHTHTHTHTQSCIGMPSPVRQGPRPGAVLSIHTGLAYNISGLDICAFFATTSARGKQTNKH
ncbi:hypothetical protein MAPG_05913 [Magnaporthiopsis poae ATCC 64411]|uniref:Uncharacterized protein n=1 Tax=Magnaporthiopsis poae (strain ATCC 64411 / 73-15) TaxID=644358 RepID=A0A0C4E0N2_MAGP6|nr:hypothetical protein MAPG_05913 [Magnaporthiopsis poae ATCC 64411]